MAMTNIYYNDVPEEICYEILLRLPSKSLCRFRCVCMSWCRLITTQAFISSHLNKQLDTKINTNMLLTLCRRPRRHFWKNDVTFCSHAKTNKLGIYKIFGVPSFLPESYAERCLANYKIVGSCNGLVCLKADLDIILWNPSIEKYVRLPPFDADRWGWGVAFGFGVNLLNGDFKVIRLVFRNKTLPQPLAEVYSLKSREWKLVEFKRDFHTPGWFSRNQVYMNGSSHWIYGIVGNKQTCFLVSFDMSNEVLNEVSVAPEQLDLVLMHGEVVKFPAKLVTINLRKECLGIAIEQGCGRIDIWVMREYGVSESWCNLYTIDVKLMETLKFVGFMENGKVLVNVEEKGQEDQLMIHDPHSKLTLNLGDWGRGLYSYKYMESLVLLDDATISVKY